VLGLERNRLLNRSSSNWSICQSPASQREIGCTS